MCVGVFANKLHCQSPSRRYPSSVGLGRPIRDAKVKAQPVFAAGSTAPTMPGTIGIHGRRLGRRGKAVGLWTSGGKPSASATAPAASPRWPRCVAPRRELVPQPYSLPCRVGTSPRPAPPHPWFICLIQINAPPTEFFNRPGRRKAAIIHLL